SSFSRGRSRAGGDHQDRVRRARSAGCDRGQLRRRQDEGGARHFRRYHPRRHATGREWLRSLSRVALTRGPDADPDADGARYRRRPRRRPGSRRLVRLRLRLTIWYVATFGLIIVLLGGGLFVDISHQISQQLDDSLFGATQELVRAARIRELEQASVRGRLIDAVDELNIPD